MYYTSTVVDASFEDAIAQVTEALKSEGFGVLTEIDVRAAFEKKLGIEFRRYQILGACHPQIAYEMLQVDDKAGTLYPCNVVVQEWADGRVEVAAIEPLMMFLALHSPRAKEIAMTASQKMQAVMDRLAAAVGSQVEGSAALAAAGSSVPTVPCPGMGKRARHGRRAFEGQAARLQPQGPAHNPAGTGE